MIAAPRQTYPFQYRFDADRYPGAYLAAPWTEAQVQSQVAIRLRTLGCEAVIVDSGAKAIRAVLARRGIRASGLPPAAIRGLVDIAGCDPRGRAIFLEVKRPARIQRGRVVARAGEATIEQLAFLSRVWARGAIAGVTWGPADLDAILKPWPLEGV